MGRTVPGIGEEGDESPTAADLLAALDAEEADEQGSS
jgi:hypothetical protein